MKKIYSLLIFVFSLLIGINVYAVTTYSRTEENLGVSKKWNITSSNKSNVLRTPWVNAGEKIYDFADVISEDDEKELFHKISEFIEQSNMDMVVITTDLTYSDHQLEDYAADFYDYNDFGLNFDHYSGILLIRNVNDYNRFFNIYTFGDAQLYFTYERCESILDDIFDDIHGENYRSGIEKFVEKSIYYYNLGIPNKYSSYYIDDMGYIRKNYTIPYIPAILFSFIVTLIVVLILIKRNTMVKKEENANIYLNKSSVNFTKMQDVFLHSHTSSYTVSSSSGTGSGGSHFGSSGGGHGGGGGRHG